MVGLLSSGGWDGMTPRHTRRCQPYSEGWRGAPTGQGSHHDGGAGRLTCKEIDGFGYGKAEVLLVFIFPPKIRTMVR